MPAQMIALEGGKSKYAVSQIRVEEPTVGHALGSEDPVSAVQASAAAQFDASNIHVDTEAATRLEQLRYIEQAENQVAAEVQGERKRTAAWKYAKTPARHDAAFRLSVAERCNQGIYILLRYVTLCVSTLVVALYARGSGFSADISTNWALAIAFAFPALIGSAVIAGRVDLKDDLEQKRAMVRRLAYVAIGLLVVWVAASAILFAPKEASATAFQVRFGSSGSGLQMAQALVDQLFPKSVVGILLLFTHVLTDTFMAAALAGFAKLQGLKGRETEFVTNKEFLANNAHWDFHQGRLTDTRREILFLEGVRKAVEAGREACVRDAVARVQSHILEVRAAEMQAKVDVIRAKVGKAPDWKRA